jgi:hypothetical protein
VTEAQLQERLRFLLASLLKLAADLKDEGVSDAPRGSRLQDSVVNKQFETEASERATRRPDAPDWVGP